MNIQMTINIKKIIQPIIIILLLFINIFLGLKLYFYQCEVNELAKQTYAQKTNLKIYNFTKLFIEKVLISKEEVDFETRLKLENSIRDINDEALFNKWRKFTEDTNPEDIQNDVATLLQMLVNKLQISYDVGN